MSSISEEEWRDAMTKIFDKLTKDQYKKMLIIVDFSTPQKKTEKFKRELPQAILEKYGLEESIMKVNKAMEEIPRKDQGVQNLLRPFVEKLGKQEAGPALEADPAGAPELEHTRKDEDPTLNSSQPTETVKVPRKTIQELKTSGQLDQKFIIGKIVQKSDPATYLTKKKEKKFFFKLGIADETDCIKVIVYGKERFQDLKLGCFYNFRDVIVDMEENVIKVTEKTRISKTAPFDIPKNLELEAAKLINQPVCCIAEVQTYEDKTAVSVEGTVKTIDSSKRVPLKKDKRMKKDKQEFELQDDTGTIRICMWGEHTKHLCGISLGDRATVTNVKTNRFRDIPVSLNSTDLTKIVKLASAAPQNITMMIIGLTKATTLETELEAQINDQMATFVAASSLLVKELGIPMGANFEARLLDQLPFSAEAQIKGNKILQLKAVQKTQQ
ncbi:uncharacterized protein LOC133459975 isoform X2 [Cololabis saira]|uniref:uncharacterized protein LOC133459975 isoform X2 n=1 Tax=Cololabis saira TaxID=129043 RepID=UPI002AD3415D|nr:uncharacterized protein LOC133459975 isoform X2 [Cololabis saira]